MSDEFWTDEDRKYGRKVGYVVAESGRVTTAYLDSHLGNGIYTGVNKHTDEPVRVQWFDGDGKSSPEIWRGYVEVNTCWLFFGSHGCDLPPDGHTIHRCAAGDSLELLPCSEYNQTTGQIRQIQTDTEEWGPWYDYGAGHWWGLPSVIYRNGPLSRPRTAKKGKRA